MRLVSKFNIPRKKVVLANALDKTKILIFLNLFKKNTLTIFNYHRIYKGSLLTDFDENVYTCSENDFFEQMHWLKRNCNILSADELIEISIKNTKIPKQSAAVTFDDGYKDNYELAFPILKSLNIPAVFFIPTQSIIERKLGWWEIISYLVKKSSSKSLEVNSKKISIVDNQEKKQAIAHLIELFKTTPFSETENLLTLISEQCRVNFPSTETQSQNLMSWEEVKEVSNNGITIGSHTHSHRVLSTISESNQLEELNKSKTILEDKLKKEINLIAYPVGGYNTFSNNTKKLAQESGYKIGFSFNTGINQQQINDCYDIKRVNAPNSFSYFKSITLLPSIFSET